MNGPFALPGSSPQAELERKLPEGWLPRGHVDGLILSNDAGDLTNDIGIAPGAGKSTVNAAYVYSNAYSTLPRHQRDIEITDALIKQLDVVWAPGNGGGRSASALSNTTWHAFGIGGKGLKDSVLFHDSATQSSVLAALPGGYTAYRMIGSIIRASAAILAFTQTNDEFLLSSVVSEVSNTAPGGTSAVTLPLTGVPLGVVVNARVNALNNASTYIRISALSTADVAPSATVPNYNAGGGTQIIGATLYVQTDALRQIRYRCTANAAISIGTEGFVHPRGRDA